MSSSINFDNGKVFYSVVSDPTQCLVKAYGAETYLLTSKETGELALAAFDSKIAANRFFASTSDYFFQKIN